MTNEEHNVWAKKCLAHLVGHVKEFEGGPKHLTYGQLAKAVGYPEPHTGNLFGSNIGATLGVMGHLFDGMVIDDNKVPMMQALVVSSSSKLPSDGLKEFVRDYPSFPIEKKRDTAREEHRKIFSFGERWEVVLERLDVKFDSDSSRRTGGSKKFNPWGSEGSPEHRRLRDHVRSKPTSVGVTQPIEDFIEYPLKSGDSVDVVFIEGSQITAVEVKSRRSGFDDIERGLFQAVKYESVLRAEEKCSKESREVRSILVLEGELPRSLYRVRKLLNVDVLELYYSTRRKLRA